MVWLLTMKSTMKKILALILAFVISAMICVPAFAIESAYSASSTVTVNGYTYTYYSYIERWNDELLSARVHASANTSVPIGYIGVRARMYNSNGALEKTGDWLYSDMVLVGLDTSVYVAVDPDVYYYSKGQVRFYTGNGYSTYSANASPNMILGKAKSLLEVTTNENGEIYGSELYLDSIGVKADLIYAIGENGVEGYVKAIDLEGPAVETPEEAVQQIRENREIPLYASDGVSVIGRFVIQNNTPSVIAQ